MCCGSDCLSTVLVLHSAWSCSNVGTSALPMPNASNELCTCKGSWPTSMVTILKTNVFWLPATSWNQFQITWIWLSQIDCHAKLNLALGPTMFWIFPLPYSCKKTKSNCHSFLVWNQAVMLLVNLFFYKCNMQYTCSAFTDIPNVCIRWGFVRIQGCYLLTRFGFNKSIT